MADIPYSESHKGKYLRFYRTGVRQKPFVQPKELPYSLQIWKASIIQKWGPYINEPTVDQLGIASRAGELYNSALVAWGSSNIPNWAKVIYSNLYNKLLSKTGERASLLTALAEWRSTSDMVLNRLVQIYKGIRSLRRGRFREFLRVFNVAPKRKHRHTKWTKPRDAAGLWLEYWFGWAPTIGDIQNAIAVFTGEIPEEKVRVSAGARSLNLDKQSTSGVATYWSKLSASFIMQLRATVRITNPNLYLANASGLLNPLRTAWETTPFSWFADWFTNLGQVLGSLTDELGVSISDVWLSRLAKGTESWMTSWEPSYPSGSKLGREMAFMSRERLGRLPKPELIIRVPDLSWTRAATLSSLIVSFFAPPRIQRV